MFWKTVVKIIVAIALTAAETYCERRTKPKSKA